MGFKCHSGDLWGHVTPLSDSPKVNTVLKGAYVTIHLSIHLSLDTISSEHISRLFWK